MKKIIIFLVVIIGLFAAIAIINNTQQKEKSEDNPYGKDTLRASTVEQLDDPNYQNLILPDALKDKLDKEENVTVYFYSPECPHCIKTTPVVNPVAKEMNIDLVQYNLLEFEEGWDDYQIKSTPTIVHYEKGKEKARIVGSHKAEEFKDFFQTNIK
ncbi:thiol reductase thioredoxin [Bacillus sp. M6-12]|uniref:thioredoxin family protein n=1 Tax=Bacillus sp. M6-12 TaxID=2054166 RepID=UPI000C78D4A0|nr:thioredoxin family protein [Bacillus sp. M6-12]PLS17652.1 thiol reductase thioredoxin [Bacillus sp. M6-12]